MTIFETISKDRINAMREKNGPVKSVTQIVAAKFKNEEIVLKRPLTEEEGLSILRKELKQTEDSLQDAQRAGSDTEEYRAQIEYLKGLLPAAMTPEAVKAEVAEIAKTLDAPNKGSLMKAVMPALKGRADGKDISAAVDAYLAAK